MTFRPRKTGFDLGTVVAMPWFFEERGGNFSSSMVDLGTMTPSSAWSGPPGRSHAPRLQPVAARGIYLSKVRIMAPIQLWNQRSKYPAGGIFTLRRLARGLDRSASWPIAPTPVARQMSELAGLCLGHPQKRSSRLRAHFRLQSGSAVCARRILL